MGSLLPEFPGRPGPRMACRVQCGSSPTARSSALLAFLGVPPSPVCSSSPALTEPSVSAATSWWLPRAVPGRSCHTRAGRWHVCVHVCGSGSTHGASGGLRCPAGSTRPTSPPCLRGLPLPGSSPAQCSLAHLASSSAPQAPRRDSGWQQALSPAVRGCVVDVTVSRRLLSVRDARTGRALLGAVVTHVGVEEEFMAVWEAQGEEPGPALPHLELSEGRPANPEPQQALRPCRPCLLGAGAAVGLAMPPAAAGLGVSLALGPGRAGRPGPWGSGGLPAERGAALDGAQGCRGWAGPADTWGVPALSRFLVCTGVGGSTSQCRRGHEEGLGVGAWQLPSRCPSLSGQQAA